MKFCFGDIVVVCGNMIGVVLKSWIRHISGEREAVHEYEVYVRVSCDIKVFREEDMERYMVRHKVLDEEEIEWQSNAVRGI